MEPVHVDIRRILGRGLVQQWYLLRFVADSHPWVRSLPLRYAIAFLFAYACFFLAVGAWIEIVRGEPENRSEHVDWFGGGTWGGGGEGCFVVLAVLLVGFVTGGIFLFVGGAPMLLEAAFEAAFAGIIVRRPLSGDIVLGGRKVHLLGNTWKQALLGIMVLVALAAWLQQHVPQAFTFADALRGMGRIH